MSDDRYLCDRRSLLRTGALTSIAGLSGCLDRIPDEVRNQIPGQGEQDADGDGISDAEDYAPRDPSVQAKSDVQSDETSANSDSEAETAQSTTTATETQTGSVFVDRFDDDTFTDTWQVSEQDDETIAERNGLLLHDSPHAYNAGGNMVTRSSFSASGRLRLRVQMQSQQADYWGYGFGLSFGDQGWLGLKEHKWEDNDRLVLTLNGQNVDKVQEKLAAATDSTEALPYELRLDFDSMTIDRIRRGDRTFSPGIDLPDAFATDFALVIGNGRGHRVAYQLVQLAQA